MKNELVELADEILAKAKSNKITLKLLGGIAFWKCCPQNRDLFLLFNRNIKDIDFYSTSEFKSKIETILLRDFKLKMDWGLATIPYSLRSVFYNDKNKKVCEINYNKLIYSHEFYVKNNNFENVYDIIPLTDLLVSKLQIHAISEKDVIDVIVLLLEYDFDDVNENYISLRRVSELCYKDWGLEHTIRKNCIIIYKHLSSLQHSVPFDKGKISSKLLEILNKIKRSKKSLKWKIRNHFSEIYDWYNYVEPY